MKISENLRTILKERNIKPCALEERIGMKDSGYIYRIIRGDIENPRVYTVKKIADYLEVSIEELII
ncbi:helix-turn-helix domain-containing protein [Faecalimicrobium sp. JNUCC 81]